MRIFLSVSVVVLLLVVIVMGAMIGWLVFTRQAYEQPTRPDAPLYGQRGAYTTGYQVARINDSERPLNVWVWYPAVGEQALATYSAHNGVFETAGVATRDAEVAIVDAPYPLVVLSHGNGGSPLLHSFLGEHLASQGFVVVGVEHRGNTVLDRLTGEERYDDLSRDNYIYRPQDVTRTIDFALDDLNNGALSGMIDADKIAVMGHSFGGYTAFASAGAQLNMDALSEWCETNQGVTVADRRDAALVNDATRDIVLVDGVCYLLDAAPRLAELAGYDDVPDGAWDSLGDERINAVVAMSPWNAPIFGEDSLGAVTLPTLILVGENDSVTPPERDAYNFDAWLGSDERHMVTFAHGDHYLFINHCPPVLINAGFYGACSDPVWDLQRAHDLTNHFTTAFLRGLYYDDEAAAAILSDDAQRFAGVRVR